MPSEKEKNEEQTSQERQLRQRKALNDAFAALIGQQNTQTFQAFTIEDALDEQIEQIEGAGTRIRPNQLARVDRVESGVLEAVEQLKAIPDEAFKKVNEDEDVNT